MVAELKRMERERGQRDKMEALIGFSQHESAVGFFDVEVGGRRERLDTAFGTRTVPQKNDDQLAQGDEAANGEETKEGRRRFKEETTRCGSPGTREARGSQETDAGEKSQRS